MIMDGARSIVNPHGGAVTLLNGAAEVSTTTSAGNLQVNSTGTVSGQVVPGIGQTVDLRMPASNPMDGSGGSLSAGTSVASGALDINNGGISGVTLSVGYVAGPPVPFGLNSSADLPVLQRMGDAIGDAASATATWLQDHLLD